MTVESALETNAFIAGISAKASGVWIEQMTATKAAEMDKKVRDIVNSVVSKFLRS
jgi:hypothetical protein